MTGCAQRPPPVDFEKDFLQEKAKYEPNIGKNYWLLGERFLCPTPVTNVLHCTSIPAGSKLKLDGVELGVTSDAHYHVTLDDGRTGYIAALGLVMFGTDVDPAQTAAECKRRGQSEPQRQAAVALGAAHDGCAYQCGGKSGRFRSARSDGAGAGHRHRRDCLRLCTLFLGAACPMSWFTRWAFPWCAHCPSRPVSSRRCSWCSRSSN